MSITRRWYAYTGIRGGQLNHQNYILEDFFPSCDVTGNNVCCIYGIYEISGSVDPSEDIVYGLNPQTFVKDTVLGSYISITLAQPSFYPAGPGQKPYVYKKTFS